MVESYVQDGEGNFWPNPELKGLVAGKVADANVAHFNLKRNRPSYDPETAYVLDEGRSRGYIDLQSPIERFIEQEVTNGLGYWESDSFKKFRSSHVSTTDELRHVLSLMDISTGQYDVVEHFKDVALQTLTLPEGPDRDSVLALIPDEIKHIVDLELRLEELNYR